MIIDYNILNLGAVNERYILIIDYNILNLGAVKERYVTGIFLTVHSTGIQGNCIAIYRKLYCSTCSLNRRKALYNVHT